MIDNYFKIYCYEKKNYFVTDYNKIISKKTKKLYLLREMNNYF